MKVQNARCMPLMKTLLAVTVLSLCAASSAFADGFTLGDAANYAVLYEGNGNNQLSTTNVIINGNIGIGDPSGVTTAFLAASGGTPAVINGNVDYAGAVSSSQSVSNTTITGTISGGHANVQADLNYLNTLSSTLGAESGTALTVNLNNNQSQTINVANGILDANGNRVFNVSSFNFGNGATLTINGNGINNVVLNFSSNVQFGGTIVLTGGLTSDEVLFNVIGGSGLTGGNTDMLNNNGEAFLTGTFLDPNGAISVVHTDLTGRVFGGDTSNMQIVSGDTINTPGTQVPEPGSMLLLGAGLSGAAIWRRRRS